MCGSVLHKSCCQIDCVLFCVVQVFTVCIFHLHMQKNAQSFFLNSSLSWISNMVRSRKNYHSCSLVGFNYIIQVEKDLLRGGTHAKASFLVYLGGLQLLPVQIQVSSFFCVIVLDSQSFLLGTVYRNFRMAIYLKTPQESMLQSIAIKNIQNVPWHEIQYC